MWSFFSRDPATQFNYEIGNEIPGIFGRSVWHLHTGKSKSNGDLVSIFALDVKSSNESQVSLAKKSLKRFKTLRHPSVVTYIDELETEKVIYMVTEKVIPLEIYLAENKSEGSNTDYAISWGLHQVINGIGFLNDANLIHGNISISSIFVDAGGEWKIGGLEFMCASSEQPMKLPGNLQAYEPPEVTRGGTITQKLQYTRDLWGIGCLMWEVFNGTLNKTTQLKIVGKINKLIASGYCELVSANPKSRPITSKFLMDCKSKGGYMDNDFVKTMLFMEEIEIKDQNERTIFFDHLTKKIDEFPSPACKLKILPKLLKAYDFGGAGSSILSPILKLGKYLDDSEYQQRIVPCVVKLFSSPDRATRVKLLQQLEVFAPQLQPKTVNEQIFPSVLPGFMDTNPLVRENTIKAMIHLAPKLGFKQLNEELMKHFARLQSKDPEGGIRTNTTICLGKISCYLNPQTRQKILISAFTRGIRDPCKPARLASIQAMAATQRFFTVQDIGTRLLPVLVLFTVDPDVNIREAVFKVVKCFLANLKKVSENPELIAELEKDVLSGDAINYDESWSGWAMSLTSKIYKTKEKRVTPKRDTDSAEKKVNTDVPLTKTADKIENKSLEIAEDRNRSVEAAWSDEWKNEDNVTEEVDDVKKEQSAESDDWGNEGWGDMDDMDDIDDSTPQEDFISANPELAASSTYDGWLKDDKEWLPIGSTPAANTSSDNFGDDFFSSVSKSNTHVSPAKGNEHKSSPKKPVSAPESKFAVQSKDDWSNDGWGSFENPTESKTERRAAKSKPLKLGAKKIGQD